MFTGIVEELGEVVSLIDGGGDSAVIAVRGPLVTSDARHGDSISVNGVCLTVIEVNLERAALAGSRLGGHLVQGHVDGVSRLKSREPASDWEVLSFELPKALSKYVVEKGSITVDGVSLTVMAVDDESFSVGLIPTTLKMTVLGSKAVGDPVNLEVDVIAKYVEKMLGGRNV
jgi:riboflavin synthase